ncbi:MAG: zf-HC2 domain-containing protein [Bacteriovoracaceae bacterium]
MIEAQPFKKYQNKIAAYLDGTLSQEEKAEFEAFVRTHPEFENEIKNKENEISLIKSLIPHGEVFARSYQDLEKEMRSSVFNLLKEPQRSPWQKVNDWLEERFSR